MKKSEIRKAVKDFFVRPTKRFDAIAWLWGKGLVVAWSSILSVVGFVTGNGTVVLLSYFLVFVGFLYVYQFLAKGR